MPTHPRKTTHHHRIVSISRHHEYEVDGKRAVRATFTHGFDASTAATAISAGSSVLLEIQSRNKAGEWIRTGWAFRGHWSASLPAFLVALRKGRGMTTDLSLLAVCPSTFDIDRERQEG